jgi:hypothetical protein
LKGNDRDRLTINSHRLSFSKKGNQIKKGNLLMSYLPKKKNATKREKRGKHRPLRLLSVPPGRRGKESRI